MEAICGANCDNCDYYKNNQCQGCRATDGCPFGKKCWIAKYINIGGKKKFNELKKELIDEFNSLNIEGMKKIDELYSLNGSFVNLEYTLPNGIKTKLLDDNDIYLGNQVESEYNDNEVNKCFGLVANMNFLIVCEYDKGGTNPELLIYKKR